MSAAIFDILSYGCTSAAGDSASALWNSLSTGKLPQSMRWPESGTSREILGQRLHRSWKETWNGLSTRAQKRLHERPAPDAGLGVILASTKGCVDDLVWAESPDLSRDTLAPLLDDFLAATGLKPQRRTCVSNACTSGLSALYLARHWLRHAGLSDVIIISTDRAGEFVQKGFASLKVLTPDQTRPFAGTRSGFKLGDAAACLILSSVREEACVSLTGASVDSQGHAVTRPSQLGESLEAACRQALAGAAPDLVIAHGTSTQVNDATEDRVYGRLFIDDLTRLSPRAPLITATKWCTGHTLGASSALDVIAACEALKHQSAFAIATTDVADTQFKNRYAVARTALGLSGLKRVMVSSLGFGGIHAACVVEKNS